MSQLSTHCPRTVTGSTSSIHGCPAQTRSNPATNASPTTTATKCSARSMDGSYRATCRRRVRQPSSSTTTATCIHACGISTSPEPTPSSSPTPRRTKGIYRAPRTTSRASSHSIRSCAASFRRPTPSSNCLLPPGSGSRRCPARSRRPSPSGKPASRQTSANSVSKDDATGRTDTGTSRSTRTRRGRSRRSAATHSRVHYSTTRRETPARSRWFPAPT